MKKFNLFLLVSIFVFSGVFCFAEENEEQEIPEGMEVVQDGRLKVIVPKGVKKRIEDNITYVEPTDAYFARKFMEMEAHLAELEAKEEKLEAKVEQLKQESGQLKEALDEIKDKLPE